MGSSSSIRQKHVTHGSCVEQAENFQNVRSQQLGSKASKCTFSLEAANGTVEKETTSCGQHEINKISDWSRQSTPSTVAPEVEDDRYADTMVEDDDEEVEREAQALSHAEKVRPIEHWSDLPGVVARETEEMHGEDWTSPRSPNRSAARKRTSSDGVTSPKALTSRSYIERWTEPDETLILFDFDDTLCPSSHMMENPESVADQDPSLQIHEAAAIHLLEVARSLGHVQIVTMADETWVDRCISALMPGLREKLTELNIGVSGARANVPGVSMREAHADAREPSQFLKTRVMKRVIQNFYGKGQCRPRSWKNILSIGDSEAERLALQDIVFRRIQKDRDGSWKECRCKTLLLLPAPKIEELTAELKLVAQLLPAMVHHDGDLDMDLEQDELEAALQELVR